jgi:hypothetical protein
MPQLAIPRSARPGRARDTYLAWLGGAFALFNSIRIFAYMPTMVALLETGDSSQHSLLTWLCFLGGNTTMALWLWEQNGRRCNRAIAVNAGNAAMCLAIVTVILWTRL